MTGSAGRRGHSTIADLLTEPESRGLELVDGELVEKAAPDFQHGRTQARIAQAVSEFDRRGGGGRPGGWWIGTEIDVQLGEDVCRPDLAG